MDRSWRARDMTRLFATSISHRFPSNGRWISASTCSFRAIPFGWSPQLVGAMRVSTPKDLSRCTLLQMAASPDDWSRWLAAANVEGTDATRGPRFDSYAMTVEAATSGWGFAMAREDFIIGDLEYAPGRTVRAPTPKQQGLVPRHLHPPAATRRGVSHLATRGGQARPGGHGPGEPRRKRR